MNLIDPTLESRTLALVRTMRERLPVGTDTLAATLGASEEQTAWAVINLHDERRLVAAVEGGCASATVMAVY